MSGDRPTVGTGRSRKWRARIAGAAVGAAAVVFGGIAAAAWLSQSDGDAEVSEVVVTGTQLRGVAPVGSALVSVDQEQIRASGAISTNVAP